MDVDDVVSSAPAAAAAAAAEEDEKKHKADDAEDAGGKKSKRAKTTAAAVAADEGGDDDGEEDDEDEAEKSLVVEGKRARKSVERHAPPEAAPPAKEAFSVRPGAGQKIGTMGKVVERLEKIKSDQLTDVHRFLFGVPGQKHHRKANIREFSGFPSGTDLKKKREWLLTRTTQQLKDMSELFHTGGSGQKEERVDKMVAWFEKPSGSTAGSASSSSKSPKASKGKKDSKKKTSKKDSKKGKTPEKKSGGSAKKAKPASAAAALPHPDEPKKAVMFYAMVHGQRIRSATPENAALSEVDLMHKIRDEYNALADDAKQPFETMEHEDAKRYKDAMVVYEEKKKKLEEEEKKKKEEEEKEEEESDDDDDEEEEEEEEEEEDEDEDEESDNDTYTPGSKSKGKKSSKSAKSSKAKAESKPKESKKASSSSKKSADTVEDDDDENDDEKPLVKPKAAAADAAPADPDAATKETIKKTVNGILEGANLEELSAKKVRLAVAEKHPDVDVEKFKAFIGECLDQFLAAKA